MDTAEDAARDIAVLHADAWLLAVMKPARMLSVPGKGPGKEDCAAARARAWAAARGMRPEGPMVVHRLDMDTSGVMVFGMTAEAQRRLSREFEERRVEKRYVALVEGLVEGDSGEIDAAIRLDPAHRPFRVVDETHGQPARTRWRVLAWETDRTRVEFEPVTGRTHQLRVHASEPAPVGLGRPIVGDVLYGAEGRAMYSAMVRGDWSGVAPAPEGRLMLHASRVSLLHPGSGRRVSFESPAPF